MGISDYITRKVEENSIPGTVTLAQEVWKMVSENHKHLHATITQLDPHHSKIKAEIDGRQLPERNAEEKFKYTSGWWPLKGEVDVDSGTDGTSHGNVAVTAEFPPRDATFSGDTSQGAIKAAIECAFKVGSNIQCDIDVRAPRQMHLQSKTLFDQQQHKVAVTTITLPNGKHLVMRSSLTRDGAKQITIDADIE